MRPFRLAGAVLLAVLVTAAEARDLTHAEAGSLTRTEAINQAGRQRMLTQRIVKSYLQIGLGVNADASRARLTEAARLFDEQTARLRQFAPEPEVRAALEELERLWPSFRAAATGSVSRDGARALSAQSAPLLAAAERLAAALERAGAGTVGRLVNLAGRQRMLSQQLAKTYMLFIWGLDDSASRGELQAAAAEFGAALTLLRAAPENTEPLHRELEAAATQWEWLLGAVAQYDTTAYPLVVDEASEAILARMERVTRLYEALGAR
jgi:hypothetical protein